MLNAQSLPKEGTEVYLLWSSSKSFTDLKKIIIKQNQSHHKSHTGIRVSLMYNELPVLPENLIML